MDYVYAIILGLVQGVTEFLPISSTAHLILIADLFHLSPEQFGLSFDVALHVGTAIAVLIYFWKTWYDLIIKAYTPGVKKEQSTDRKLLLAIIIGTIPALIFGMILESTIQNNLRSPVVIAVALIAGSGVFYLAEKFAKQNRPMTDMTYTNSFMIGLSQVGALIPGVSRSGITISTGLFQGYDRESAARFAFLLSTPVIFGAALYLVLKILFLEPTRVDWSLFLVGAITSFITGYLTIAFLLRFLKDHPLTAFNWYRIGLAIVVIILLATGILTP